MFAPVLVDLPPMSGRPALAAAQAVARATWPASPCAGRERVVFRSLAPERVAQAYLDGTCAIELDPSLRGDRYALCVAVVHEYGHLAAPDEPHTDDGSVMDADASTFKPCEAVEGETPRQFAADTIGVAARACRILKARHSYRDYRCVAGHRSKRVRVYVSRNVPVFSQVVR